jgi:hypothetical protein
MSDTLEPFDQWVIADRLRRAVGLPYRLDESERLHELVRLAGEQAAGVADRLGAQDVAAAIRQHFGMPRPEQRQAAGQEGLRACERCGIRFLGHKKATNRFCSRGCYAEARRKI